MLKLTLQAVIVCCLVLMVFSVFLGIRNQWVFRQRRKLMESNFETFKKLPSYEKMVWRWWVWDIYKFLP
jgi:hypothetical protein